MSLNRPAQMSSGVLLSTSRLVKRRAFVAAPRSEAPLARQICPLLMPSRPSASRPIHNRRHYASPSSSDLGGVKISYLFGGLVGFGLLLTTYGLLEYYFSLGTWPEHVRTPLKAAIKARNAGDYVRSEQYFQKAIEAALALPSSSLQPDPLQKLTGLYVSYAALLESQGQHVKAYVALRNALRQMGDTPLTPSTPAGQWAGASYVLTPEDHIRAIGLSQKLGHLALQLSASSHPPPFPIETDRPTSTPTREVGWLEAAEYHLTAAVTSMLKLGLAKGSESSGSTVIAGRDVQLAESPAEEAGGRVDKRGLGMTMEALSEVCARKKQYELAGQALLQAISLLLPPAAKETPPARDRCQAAQLMTSVSSHALQARDAQAIKVSRSWSLQALRVADGTLAEIGVSTSTDPTALICNRARAVAMQNLGMLAEMEKDPSTALRFFDRSLTLSKEIGFAEGRREAIESIRRLRNQGFTETTTPGRKVYSDLS